MNGMNGRPRPPFFFPEGNHETHAAAGGPLFFFLL